MNVRECVRVHDGRTHSCVGCHKAKQKCEGAVWSLVEEDEVAVVEVKAAGPIGADCGNSGGDAGD